MDSSRYVVIAIEPSPPPLPLLLLRLILPRRHTDISLQLLSSHLEKADPAVFDIIEKVRHQIQWRTLRATF